MAAVLVVESELVFYAGLPVGQALTALECSELQPDMFMPPWRSTSWIPLKKSRQEAIARAEWGAEECGHSEHGIPPDFAVVKIVFSAQAAYHFVLAGNLYRVPHHDSWRFYGNLPLQVLSPDGTKLVKTEFDF